MLRKRGSRRPPRGRSGRSEKRQAFERPSTTRRGENAHAGGEKASARLCQKRRTARTSYEACPLWVISGPRAVLRPCPVCPPPKADINRHERRVRFAPKADMSRCSK